MIEIHFCNENCKYWNNIMQSLCYRFFFSINSVMYEAWQIITTDNKNINIFSHNNVISGYDFLRSLPNVSERTKRRSEMTKRQIYIYLQTDKIIKNPLYSFIPSGLDTLDKWNGYKLYAYLIQPYYSRFYIGITNVLTQITS